MSKSNKWTKAKRDELEQVVDGVVDRDLPFRVSPAGVISWSWKGQRRTLAVAPDKIVITAGAVVTTYEGRDGDETTPHYRDNPDVAICLALLKAGLNILPD